MTDPVVSSYPGYARRDPLAETLARIGRDMAQQQMAADRYKRLGLDDRHNYHEYHRFSQGRWGFYESARLICQYFGQDFELWLSEWEPESEERPADDPPDEIVCDGRNCGGFPHG